MTENIADRVDRPEYATDEVLFFLDRIRIEGQIRMVQAVPYMVEAFEDYPLTKKRAFQAVYFWQETYRERWDRLYIDCHPRNGFIEDIEMDLEELEALEGALDRIEDLEFGPAQDYLMWVGAYHYPTIESFVEEAKERGVAKRIGKLPKDIVEGKSRVFLAHDEGLAGDGMIFGYFTVEKIHYIVQDQDDIPFRYRGGVDHVTPLQAQAEENRLCGTRDEEHSVYKMSRSNLRDGFVVLEPFRKLDYFVELSEWHGGHFRGALQIDCGDEIVGAEDPDSLVSTRPREEYESVREDGKVPHGWTDEQEADLWAYYREGSEEGKSNSRIGQEYSYMTGRSKESILARIRKIQKELAQEPASVE